jgi:hypothetical protein
MVSPGYYLCNVRAEAEEIVEHRVYNATDGMFFGRNKVRLKKKLSIKHLRISWHNKMAELRRMLLFRGSHCEHCCVCLLLGGKGF